MFLGARPRMTGERRLEDWLGEVLVPVEPSLGFRRNLRARLVNYRGDRLASPWMILAVIGTSILLLVTVSTYALRLVIAILGGIHLLSRRRNERRLRLSEASGRR